MHTEKAARGVGGEEVRQAHLHIFLQFFFFLLHLKYAKGPAQCLAGFTSFSLGYLKSASGVSPLPDSLAWLLLLLWVELSFFSERGPWLLALNS